MTSPTGSSDDGQAPSAGETFSSSMSRASRDRSISCSRLPARRRSTSPGSRSWRSPSNISTSSMRRAACALRSPPTISSWRRGSPFSNRSCCCPPSRTTDGEPTGEELAQLLAFRLKRLDAMREAAAQLMTRKRLGRDVFARGMPEPLRISRKSTYQADLYDLLKAYAQQRQRTAVRTWQVRQRTVWSLKEAREELERLLGMSLRLGAARSASRRVPGRAGAAQDGIGERLHGNFGDDPRRRARDQAGEAVRAAPRPPPRGRGRFNGLTTTKEVNE